MAETEKEKEIKCDLSKEEADFLLDWFDEAYQLTIPRYSTFCPEPGNIMFCIVGGFKIVGIFKCVINPTKERRGTVTFNTCYYYEETNSFARSERSYRVYLDYVLERDAVNSDKLIIFESFEYFKKCLKHLNKRFWLSEADATTLFQRVVDTKEQLNDMQKTLYDLLQR